MSKAEKTEFEKGWEACQQAAISAVRDLNLRVVLAGKYYTPETRNQIKDVLDHAIESIKLLPRRRQQEL